MSFTWRLAGHGWAECAVGDDSAGAEATASYISDAPVALLTAVTRLIAGEKQARAGFEAALTAYRWIFHREADEVRIQLLQLAVWGKHDKADSEIWSSRQRTGTLGGAIIRGFDQVALEYGESEYQGKWGFPFPRPELEALRWNLCQLPPRDQ